MLRVITTAAAVLALATPSYAQLGGLGKLGDAAKKVDKTVKAVDDLTFTDAEEDELGSQISTQLRTAYGVVQDQAIHKYVSLTGMLLAKASSRPALKWTFIVLDTDGVNAFAAPGGYIHITRGALALIQSEAELADVLGHEIGHVTSKHTINAIKKQKGLALAGDAAGSSTRAQVLKRVADASYGMIIENAFDRGEEMDADKIGIALADKAGYSPAGLSTFLNSMADRYKDAKERSGVFASHPENRARVDAIAKEIVAKKMKSTALVTPRYKSSVNFKLVPVSAVAQVASRSVAAQSSSSGNSGGKGLGLSGLKGLGREQSGTQSVSSAGSRGANPDRDAKGGPNPGAVRVTITPADLDKFRQGIS